MSAAGRRDRRGKQPNALPLNRRAREAVDCNPFRSTDDTCTFPHQSAVFSAGTDVVSALMAGHT